MVSREMWINMYSWVFQRPQIALVFRTRAIFRSLKNSLMHVISKLHSKYILITIQILFSIYSRYSSVSFEFELNLHTRMPKILTPLCLSMEQDTGVHTSLKITYDNVMSGIGEHSYQQYCSFLKAKFSYCNPYHLDQLLNGDSDSWHIQCFKIIIITQQSVMSSTSCMVVNTKYTLIIQCCLALPLNFLLLRKIQ